MTGLTLFFYRQFIEGLKQMNKPKWQLGKIIDQQVLHFNVFGHMADQFVWVCTEKPRYYQQVNRYGRTWFGQSYVSNLGAIREGELTLLAVAATELLPFFLYDDPPTIPYEEWSYSNYRSNIDLENLRRGEDGI